MYVIGMDNVYNDCFEKMTGITILTKTKEIIFSEKLLNSNNKYILQKRKELNGKYIFETPKASLENKEIIIPELEENIKNTIKTFVNIITAYLPKESLISLSNNLKLLTVDNKLKKYNLKTNLLSCLFNYNITSGYYMINHNHIHLMSKFEFYLYQLIIHYRNSCSYEECIKNTLFHELLHVSSSKNNKDILFCGFSQRSLREQYTIGSAINEGYTELLNEEFFNNNTYESASYEYEKIIAKTIQVIIGETNMNKYYFDADLLGLINELSKYSDIYKVVEFIVNLDLIHYLKSNKEKNQEELRELTKDINIYLIETYINELQQEENIDSNNILKLYEALQLGISSTLFIEAKDINISDILKENNIKSPLIKERRIYV